MSGNNADFCIFSRGLKKDIHPASSHSQYSFAPFAKWRFRFSSISASWRPDLYTDFGSFAIGRCAFIPVDKRFRNPSNVSNLYTLCCFNGAFGHDRSIRHAGHQVESNFCPKITMPIRCWTHDNIPPLIEFNFIRQILQGFIATYLGLLHIIPPSLLSNQNESVLHLYQLHLFST